MSAPVSKRMGRPALPASGFRPLHPYSWFRLWPVRPKPVSSRGSLTERIEALEREAAGLRRVLAVARDWDWDAGAVQAVQVQDDSAGGAT